MGLLIFILIVCLCSCVCSLGWDNKCALCVVYGMVGFQAGIGKRGLWSCLRLVLIYFGSGYDFNDLLVWMGRCDSRLGIMRETNQLYARWE